MTDSNLVGTSFAGTNTKDLKLQLYIESDDGTKIEGIGGENTKVKMKYIFRYIKLVKSRQNMKMDMYMLTVETYMTLP